MATPIAPSTIATRQIRLKIAVELSSPWLSAGLPSRKSITCASGSASSSCLRIATGSTAAEAFPATPLGTLSGSLIRSRWLARLPGASSPVRSSAACDIITRGPIPAPAVIRSGSCSSTAAILKFLPPSRSVCPTFAFSRIRNSSATTAESPSRACAKLIAGASSACP